MLPIFGIAPLGLSQSHGMLGAEEEAPTGAKLSTRLAWESAVGSPLGPLWSEAGGHSPGTAWQVVLVQKNTEIDPCWPA